MQSCLRVHDPVPGHKAQAQSQPIPAQDLLARNGHVPRAHVHFHHGPGGRGKAVRAWAQDAGEPAALVLEAALVFVDRDPPDEFQPGPPAEPGHRGNKDHQGKQFLHLPLPLGSGPAAAPRGRGHETRMALGAPWRPGPETGC